MRQFFVGDRAAAGQILTAVEILAHALEGDLARVQFGLGTFYAAVQTAHLANRLGEIGFGLLQGHFGVGRVQLDQQLAALDAHAVIGVDPDHGAADQRGDLDLVALHVGIVGFFEPAAEHEVPQGQRGQQQHHDDQQAAQQLATTGGSCLLGSGGGGLTHGDDSQECEDSGVAATVAASLVGVKPPPNAWLRRTETRI
ncbi:hypothetical protein D3C71_1041910 [compost metagenome]